MEVRPAGRNVRRLSLLSGGERSLVALAYLFAVFRSRPSPFYLMDEVEAALDDVNLQRFLGLVHEFREGAQLIIVSHQKRTMEAADALYGVTMAPGGSSKVVSQRVPRHKEGEVSSDVAVSKVPPGVDGAASSPTQSPNTVLFAPPASSVAVSSPSDPSNQSVGGHSGPAAPPGEVPDLDAGYSPDDPEDHLETGAGDEARDRPATGGVLFDGGGKRIGAEPRGGTDA